MKSRKTIEAQKKVAELAVENGISLTDDDYEQGVQDALAWVLDELDEAPLDPAEYMPEDDDDEEDW
jgi:hypothetical protein